ncbi:MAG: DUF115 domain-containing protein [Treponemataceae bacterium]|nr:MAG: DUF115 domain-containing protein [Treponemataceae bacterium]
MPIAAVNGSGFSVFYRARYLYSKYEPEKAVLKAVVSFAEERLCGRANTLVLCFSPVLCLGLKALHEKLGADSALFLIETDKKLFDFSRAQYTRFGIDAENIFYFNLSEPSGSDDEIVGRNAVYRFTAAFESSESGESGESNRTCDSFGKKLPPLYRFMRTLRFDMSAGTAFSPELYERIQKAADSSISQFWKNRITLLHLGRLFSANTFRNLLDTVGTAGNAENAGTSCGIIPHSIEKPILVVGAGPSIDEIFSEISGFPAFTDFSAFFRHFFVLAVDTAVSPLLARNIKIDAIVQVEAQSAVDKAYYAAKNTKIPVLLDLPSRARAAKVCGGATAYFFSEFSQDSFLKRIRALDFIDTQMQPMGSVGLSATQLALILRKTDEVRVFVMGLDFAFPAAKTHCKESPHLKTRLINTTRISPLEDCAGTFVHGSFRLDASVGSAYTFPALAGYAAFFAAIFGNTKNLFDVAVTADSGGAKKHKMPLGIPKLDATKLTEMTLGALAQTDSVFLHSIDSTKNKKAADFCKAETAALEELSALLSGEKKASDAERSEKIYALLREREYLFLHFPDGYIREREKMLEIPFLKRVKAEIGFFLKVLTRRPCAAGG